MVNTKTLPGADCGSDHELLVMSMRLKIKKTKAANHPIRYDMIRIPEQFNVDIQNRFAELIPIVDEMTPNELWEKIKITTAKVAKEKLSRKRFRKKQWISDETLDLIDERRNMKAHGKNVNNPEYKEKSRAIRRACRKDKERFTEDKCEIIVGLCKQGRTSEMYKEIRTLIKKFTPKLNVIKDANGETLTENDDILARWKEHCEGLFTKCGSTGASTTDCGDNEQDNSSETTDEDDEELIPLRSEVELAVKQLKNGKATGCDDISAEMIKASGELGISLLHKLIVKIWQTGEWPEDWRRAVLIPIPKKGDLQQCSNYRTISLISHASKVMLKIIMKRIERKLEAEINVVQAGFRKGRGTRDHIFNLRMIIQKCREFNQPLFTCFVDYTKAFDSVEHQQLWTVMREMGFPKRIVSLIEALYSEQQSAVRTDSGTTDWFSVSKGVRQGCIMSPQLFSVYTESIMREVEEEQNHSEYDELSVGGTKITELRYADDTALFSTTPEGLNNLVQAVNKHSSAYKLSINAAKTKIMELDKWQENTNIVIDNINVERVQSFQYLGATFTTNGDGASNIKQRLAMAVQALNNMQYLWKSASKELKLKVLRTCIFPIGTYGCETWVLRKLDIKRINAFEMKCYRKVLRIPWIAHRTNCSILNELHLPTNWMYNFVRRQKLKYFGHVTRHNGLEKTIMQGMVAGKRSRGKPRQRWEKDITDTFGTMTAASRVAEDRKQFRSDIWAATS